MRIPSICLAAFLFLGFADAKTMMNTVNPGTLDIDPSLFANVYAISDVHGMYQELTKLLVASGITDKDLNWNAGKSLFIVVGDSIDKGPQSVEVIDLWIKLKGQAMQAGGELVHLLGNHEAEFLADPTNSKTAAFLQELKDKNIPLQDFTDPTRPRGGFLTAEPLAAKVGNWLFCHSGLYPEMNWADFRSQAQTILNARDYGNSFLSDANSILEAKDWWKKNSARNQLENRLSQAGFFGLVQGHQPGAYNISKTVGAIDSGRLVKIDTGMAPEAGGNPGVIIAFQSPSQMLQMSFPMITLIQDNGSTEFLVPQSFKENVNLDTVDD